MLSKNIRIAIYIFQKAERFMRIDVTVEGMLEHVSIINQYDPCQWFTETTCKFFRITRKMGFLLLQYVFLRKLNRILQKQKI